LSGNTLLKYAAGIVAAATATAAGEPFASGTGSGGGVDLVGRLQERILEMLNSSHEAEIDSMEMLSKVESVHGQMAYIQEQLRELSGCALSASGQLGEGHSAVPEAEG